MAANTGERTLIPAVIPPGAAHVDGMYSLGVPGDNRLAVLIAGSLASLLSDFAVRVAPKSTIRSGTASRLPQGFTPELNKELLLRTLRLVCLTDAYAPLWNELFDRDFQLDRWTSAVTSGALGDVGSVWDVSIPLRKAVYRRQALLEIDAIVGLALGITASELTTVYRTQFPVLRGYDRNVYAYDKNGRLVPSSLLAAWRTSADALSPHDRVVAHPQSRVVYEYELPFMAHDRERDIHRAYAEFSERTGNRRLNSA